MASKKGSVLDILWMAIIMLSFAMVVLICFKVYDALDDEFQVHPDIGATERSMSRQVRSIFPGVLDNSFLFLNIGLALVALFMATMVRFHPVFFVMFILVLAFIIFFAAIFANIYDEIATDPELVDLADELTFINLIMVNLPIIVGVLGTLISIVMYKVRSANEF